MSSDPCSGPSRLHTKSLELVFVHAVENAWSLKLKPLVQRSGSLGARLGTSPQKQCQQFDVGLHVGSGMCKGP